jgi:hypothetical protein
VVAQRGAAERGAAWRSVAQRGAAWRSVAHVSKSPARKPRQRKRNKISKLPIANAIIFRKAILARNFIARQCVKSQN